jgi:branched-subunit amino acid ABC-type transport system permease component
MGFNWLLYAVVVMIISGMGKEWHLILGALLLATAQVLVSYFFDSKWMNATAYIILVVFLYFRPYGFSGKKLKKTEI